MRARLTYLVLSPRTPERIAAQLVQLLVLIIGAVGLVAVMTDNGPVQLFAHVIVAAGQLFGTAA